jgi:Tol biopolymer transport system component
MKLRLAIIWSCGAVLLLAVALAQVATAGPVIISRVSTDSAGAQATAPFGGDSLNAAVSADGRYVAFESYANNLVTGDSNGYTDVFVKNTQTGATTRVSTDSSGAQATGFGATSVHPAVSADGRYVAFESYAPNLVGGDSNGLTDIFLKDTQTGTTTRVSTDSAGIQASGGSSFPDVSADGRYVAFMSDANNLVASDSNGQADVFVKDTQMGTTTRVSTDSGGAQASGGGSNRPDVSADGRYVAFFSYANNLVAGDNNGLADIFLKDTQTEATTRLSTDSSGAQATGGSSFSPAVSANGRYVAFFSDAYNLVAGDNNGLADIFLKDTQTAATTRLSTDSGGAQATGGSSYEPAVSSDGRYVAFHSGATNLVSAGGDTNGLTDVFVKDTQTGTTTRVSTDSAGAQASGDSSLSPALSADGRYVAFESYATNLVPGDSNADADIFITRSGPNQAFTWYDNVFGANWVLFANPAFSLSDAWFDLSVMGAVQSLPALPGYAPGQVPPGGTLAVRYPGLIGGPVDAGYHSRQGALTSQRILWAGNSLEEVVGADSRRLSDHFWWTWYDENSPGFKNWVLVGNPNADPVFYRIKVAGIALAYGSIPPGASVTPRFPGLIGGPVEVEAWSDAAHYIVPAKVMASQRVLINNDTAFNEVPGIPAAELSSNYLWTWYDMQSAGAQNWILMANPGASSMYYEITIGSNPPVNGGPIAPGGYETPTFPDTIGGPVRVRTFSDAGHTTPYNSIASQRVTWNNGLSFEEVPGYRNSALASAYHWTWFDQNEGPGVTNWVLISNPPDAGGPIYYTLRIGAMTFNGGPIAPGANDTPTFPGVIGGPVGVWTFYNEFTAAPSIASQRVLWNGYFNEVMGTVLP